MIAESKTCDLVADRHIWRNGLVRGPWGDCICGKYRRCCIHFADGKQCRRRRGANGSTCDKHAATWDMISKLNKAVIEGLATKKRKR